MAHQCNTMPGMAKKSDKQKRSPAYTVYARIDTQVGEALERFMAAQRIRPSMTATVEAALIELLKHEGFWPPRDEKK